MISEVELDNNKIDKIILALEKKLNTDQINLKPKIEKYSSKVKHLESEVRNKNIPPPLDNTLNIDTFGDIRYKISKKQIASKRSPKVDESFAALLFPYKEASEYYL